MDLMPDINQAGIDREHPDYYRKKVMWRTYRDLYTGGEQLKENASEYLLRRQKEPLDVYAERLNRVFYENYIGSIIDWYAATLFRREPLLHFESKSETGRFFYAQFCDDCDLKGSNLSDFFRRCFVDALVVGASHILIDFPAPAEGFTNRAEEDARGASRAFLSSFAADELINWSLDERGQYEWVVLRSSALRQPSVDSPETIEETYWYYFDKQQFRVYRRRERQQKKAPIELISQGTHGLANQNRVPLFTLKVSEGLWLMNKAALLQLEHFNKANALAWSITMGLFAMPVIYSEREWNQIVGESYYIQLGPQDKFGWTEPEGHVYEIAAGSLFRLKEEIYRVCYQTQAASDTSGSRAQSALSKQRDFTITQEVLRAYGDSVKDVMKRVLEAISAARLDNIGVSVSGVDEFDIGDFSAELEDAERLLQLGIASPTLKRQVFQKLAFKYLCDVRQETKDKIALEIEEQLAKSH